jgi:alkaline phosphatase
MNSIIKIILKVIAALVLVFFLSIGLLYLLTEVYGYKMVSKNEGKPIKVQKELLQSARQLNLVPDGEVKNIILFIGDGMGINQIELTKTRYFGKNGRMNMEGMPIAGMVETKPAGDELITDSAAGGTAIATGYKTNNKMVGMTPDSIARISILEVLKNKGWLTGLITSSALTDATPASFGAHVPRRDMQHEIAIDLAQSNINFLAGGQGGFEGIFPGSKMSIAKYAENRGYELVTKNEKLAAANDTLVLAFFENMQRDVLKKDSPEGKSDMQLKVLTTEAIKRLSKGDNFFLMVEEEGTDTGSHINDAEYMTEHLLAFDEALKVALDFAEKDGHTLVLVTADHETGGMTIVKGNEQESMQVSWSTQGHTLQPVPIFAFGPMAAYFSGKYDNTEIVKKLGRILGIDNFER